MKLDRVKNAKRGMFFGIINKFVTQFLPFVIRTVIIKELGEQYLGVSGLLFSILQVINLSELGFGTAMVYSMYKPIADDDKETICSLLKLYKKVYRIIGLIIFCVGIIITPFLPNIVKGSYPADINIYILYYILLFNTVITYWLFAYKSSLLNAHQRNDIENFLNSVMCGVQYGLQIIILFVLKNYYLYIIVMPIITIVTNLIRSRIVDRMYPEIQCRGDLSQDILQDIKKRVGALFGHQLSYTLINSADNIVISAFLGLSMVAIYNNYYLIFTAISSILSILTMAVKAGVGNSLVTETVEKNKKDFNKFALLIFWSSGWSAVCLMCLYQPFMNIWMGKELMLSINTVILLVLYFYVGEIRRIVNTFKDAAGMWWIDRKKPYIVVLVDLILDIVLVQVIGINGVIIASIISILFVYIPWEIQVFFKYYFKESSRFFYKKIIGNFIVTIGISLITYWACSLLPISGLFELVVKGIICLILPNLFYWFIYHNSVEFKALIKML